MSKITAILLCAGRGTRMNDDRTHKVCYEIAGKPVIIRLIDNFRAAGVERFVVVVGAKADKVMECLDKEPGVMYAYQTNQSGTGTATLAGLRALNFWGYTGPIIISMGDKIIAPGAIQRLIKDAQASDAAVSFLTQPKAFNPSGGRVVFSNGAFAAIVESLDEKRLQLMGLKSRSAVSVREAVHKTKLSDAKKQLLLDVALKDAKKNLTALPAPLNHISYKDVKAATEVNAAIYYSSDAARTQSYLEKVTPDNAQHELYLTDAINLSQSENKILPICISEKEDILTFSTMDELLQIQAYFKAPPKLDHLHSVCEWISDIEAGKLDKKLSDIYGKGDLSVRREPYLKALHAFLARYGDLPIIISRAPGRVNLMGRHIEHRGGSTNTLAIDRETIAVVSPRNDDIVQIANVDKGFREYQFSILDIISSYDTANWVEFIESDQILDMVNDSRGEWVNYIKAGVLRLQLENRGMLFCGMDMMFSGNIPVAAGLSSSSSIVVATMEATISLNRLNLDVQDFVALSGEGEWFVGSRGGAGDHAAMKCGQRGMITHMRFFPFSVGESAPWPKEYDIVVANSGVKAKKSAGARDKFNAMVASYEFSFMLMLESFPEYRDKLSCLRDINADNLGVAPSRIYEMLLKIPISLTVEELFSLLPSQYHARMRQVLATHAKMPAYNLRGVLLYGLAECARSERCIRLLQAGGFETLGDLMCISHNGDRVWQNGHPYRSPDSDEYLYSLIADLKSEDANRVSSAQIWNQPGCYACSTKEIDMLIDYIISRNGVLGAQLSGAGLGGCVIALVETNHTENLINSLNKIYYAKKNLPPSASVFTPVAGSLVL